jgi:hypothetical protein
MNALGFIHCAALNGHVYGLRERKTEKRPFKTTRPIETSNEKTELHMTFLPKTAEARQELLALLIAIPLSLAGTGFLFYLIDAGSRIAA